MQRNFPVPQYKHVIPLLEKELTDKIIGAAIEVHKVLGPGLLESAYQVCLEHESTLRRIPFKHLVDLSLNYKGIILDAGYVIDLVYNKRVIVELKAVERVIPVLKDGIYRRVL
jgi:GxxExxY protein